MGDIFKIKRDLINKIKAIDLQEEDKGLSVEEGAQRSFFKSKLED